MQDVKIVYFVHEGGGGGLAIKIVLAVVKRIFKYQLLREADKKYLTDFFLAKEGSSEGAGLLQMMIRRDRPLANDYPEGSSSKRRNWGFQWLHENKLYLA